jgi:hypothetical protein
MTQRWTYLLFLCSLLRAELQGLYSMVSRIYQIVINFCPLAIILRGRNQPSEYHTVDPRPLFELRYFQFWYLCEWYSSYEDSRVSAIAMILLFLSRALWIYDYVVSGRARNLLPGNQELGIQILRLHKAPWVVRLRRNLEVPNELIFHFQDSLVLCYLRGSSILRLFLGRLC